MEGRGEDDRFTDLGAAALDRGQHQAAVDLFRRALTLDPDEPRAHALLALALLRMKRLGAALLEAQTALVLAPEAPLSHLILGHVLLAHRKPEEARGHFESAREHDLASPAPLRGLAAVETFFDREDRAVEILEKALELDPEDVDTLSALGTAHLSRGRLDEAERHARAALEIEPEHADSLVLMGFVLLKRGDIQGAREHAVWALRGAAGETDALRLLVAIKARESLFLGLWFRFNSMLGALGPSGMLVLLGAYCVQRVLQLALEDMKMKPIAELVGYAWLGLCVYSWVAPGVFQRMLVREIKMVRLREDF
jgi:Flp pilus assembly protein TadD